jgi:hypothetical protein
MTYLCLAKFVYLQKKKICQCNVQILYKCTNMENWSLFLRLTLRETIFLLSSHIGSQAHCKEISIYVFPEKELPQPQFPHSYLFRIFGIVSLQCRLYNRNIYLLHRDNID